MNVINTYVWLKIRFVLGGFLTLKKYYFAILNLRLSRKASLFFTTTLHFFFPFLFTPKKVGRRKGEWIAKIASLLDLDPSLIYFSALISTKKIFFHFLKDRLLQTLSIRKYAPWFDQTPNMIKPLFINHIWSLLNMWLCNLRLNKILVTSHWSKKILLK